MLQIIHIFCDIPTSIFIRLIISVKKISTKSSSIKICILLHSHFDHWNIETKSRERPLFLINYGAYNVTLVEAETAKLSNHE